jgi:hypothetical protein
MLLSDLSIHLEEKEVPKVSIHDFGSFVTVRITLDNSRTEILFDTWQQVTDFKNNVLQAYESF